MLVKESRKEWTKQRVSGKAIWLLCTTPLGSGRPMGTYGKERGKSVGVEEMEAGAVLPFYSLGLSRIAHSSYDFTIRTVFFFFLTLYLYISFGPFLGLIGQTMMCGLSIVELLTFLDRQVFIRLWWGAVL